MYANTLVLLAPDSTQLDFQNFLAGEAYCVHLERNANYFDAFTLRSNQDLAVTVITEQLDV